MGRGRAAQEEELRKQCKRKHPREAEPLGGDVLEEGQGRGKSSPRPCPAHLPCQRPARASAAEGARGRQSPSPGLCSKKSFYCAKGAGGETIVNKYVKYTG